MNRLTVLKIAAYVLFAIGFIALFALPAESSPAWGRDLLVSKLIAVSAFALASMITTKIPESDGNNND